MHCADDTKNTIKELSDSDMISSCREGHPEIPTSGLSTLKFLAEPEPRAVMEGSTVIVMGSAKIGNSPHWIQGVINDASKLKKETEGDISETLDITIENLLMINHWGEECSMELPKTMIIELDQVLTSALASIETQEDIRAIEEPLCARKLWHE